MRSFMFVSLVLVLMVSIAMAGGIVTNTNQSAAYMRTLNRNVSTDVDAAYFNPAGLTRLDEGLHLSLSNQSIFQKKTVINSTVNLNNDEFVGKVSALLFPNFYAVYRMDKFAFSAGFEPIGGGGSALYEDGLPSFEIPVTSLVPQLGVDGYQLDTEFDGSSVYYAGQAGVAYKINDMVSVALGARLVMAKNAYNGYLRNITVSSGGNWVTPGAYLTGVGTTLNNTAASLQPIIDGGAGGYTLAELQGAGQLTATEVAQLEGGLVQLGVDPTGMTAMVVQATYAGAGVSTLAQVPAVEAATADVEVDATQSGTGFTPIISVFATPMEGLDISLRYEMNTTLELENKTTEDGSGMFPDGAKTRNDMPAMLALGAAYQINEDIRAEGDATIYLNGGADWDGREDETTYGWEIGAAGEYCINEQILASLGFVYSEPGVYENYHTDLSYSLPSFTVGLGAKYKVNEQISANAGLLNTFYMEKEVGVQTYQKTTFGFAIGVDYKF